MVVGDNQTNYYEYNEQTKEFTVKLLDVLANKKASKVITCPMMIMVWINIRFNIHLMV